MLRYRKLSDSGCDIGRGTTSRNEPLTTVGPVLCGCGTVCPIRSDRYCTPPYNLHGLMTSITLLRASDRSRRPLPWPRSRCATRCVLVPIPRQRTHGTHARISHRSVEQFSESTTTHGLCDFSNDFNFLPTLYTVPFVSHDLEAFSFTPSRPLIDFRLKTNALTPFLITRSSCL